MSLPPRYEEYKKCCKLKKTLYGLKQSPMIWFERLKNMMKEQSYSQRNDYYILFVKRNEKNVTILLVYVDDIIITYNDDEEMGRMKKMIVVEFELKDLGKLRYFLTLKQLGHQ